MALTYFTFCDVGFARYGLSVPVADGESAVSQGIAPSASNQTTSASTKNFVCIGTDTAVYLVFGSAPDASASTTARFYLPAGVVQYFQIEVGNKVAVIAA